MRNRRRNVAILPFDADEDDKPTEYIKHQRSVTDEDGVRETVEPSYPTMQVLTKFSDSSMHLTGLGITSSGLKVPNYFRNLLSISLRTTLILGMSQSLT